MTDDENPNTGNEEASKKEKKPRNWAKLNTVLLVIVIVLLLSSVSYFGALAPESEADKTVNNIDVNVNTLLEDNKKLTEQNNYLKQQNEQILLSINKLNTTFASRFDSIDTKLIANDVKLTDIQNKMNIMNQQLAENNNTVATLITAINILQNDTANLTMKIGEVYDMQVVINGNVCTLQTTVNEQNQMIVTLIDSVNNNTVQLGVIDETLNCLIVKVDGIDVKIDAQTAMLVNLTNQMTDVQNQLSLFYALLESLSNNSCDCTEILNLLESQMTIVMADIDNIQVVLNKVACQVNAIYKSLPPGWGCRPKC